MSFFRKSDGGAGGAASARPPRQSSGWRDVLAHLKANESLRVLDFGATSSSNINYLTGMGHSVYMANIVQDAGRPEWRKPIGDNGALEFDVPGFVESNLNFSGRDFDVVLLWDTADYLPPEVVPALFQKLHDVLRADGHLLAFFHGNTSGPDAAFCRYQLTDGPQLILLSSGDFPILKTYQTRQIEKFLQGYASTRFFLGKDNVREVIALR